METLCNLQGSGGNSIIRLFGLKNLPSGSWEWKTGTYEASPNRIPMLASYKGDWARAIDYTNEDHGWRNPSRVAYINGKTVGEASTYRLYETQSISAWSNNIWLPAFYDNDLSTMVGIKPSLSGGSNWNTASTYLTVTAWLEKK